jgi:hypothetical protein
MASYNTTELMDLLQSEVQDIPKDLVKKLTKNKFICPESTHPLHHQLNNWYGVLQICFRKTALITSSGSITLMRLNYPMMLASRQT